MTGLFAVLTSTYFPYCSNLNFLQRYSILCLDSIIKFNQSIAVIFVR